MKIAIPVEATKEEKLRVCEHFGKAPYFAIVTLEGEEAKVDVYENPALTDHKPGLLPEFLRSLGVKTLIAGGVGRRAEILFQEFGIKVIKGVLGDLEEVIKRFFEGNLEGNPDYQPEDKRGECEHH